MQRFRYIDGLRGIAILMVILHHAHPYFAHISNYYLPQAFENIVQNGDKGVTLFFVLSAFTLCMSLDKKQKTEYQPVRNYFIRRFFRIVPLYYIAVLAFMFIKYAPVNKSSLIANLLLIHGLNPLWMNSIVPGGWSVGIEVLFYLFFPFLFLKLHSATVAVNLTLVSMIVAKLITGLMFRHNAVENDATWGVFIYENIISQLPVFLTGICLYRLSVASGQKTIIPHTYLFIALLIIVHLLGGNIFKVHYLFAIVFALAAFGLSFFPAKIIVNGFTVWIGRLSYSLYLMHLLVANLLVKYSITSFTDNATTDILIRFGLILSVSIAISILTYHFIELPFQRLGVWLIEHREHRLKQTKLKNYTDQA